MDWAQHAWSNKGRVFTVDELAVHLKYIICRENEEGILPPPDINNYKLQRKNLPLLGKQISEVTALNTRHNIEVKIQRKSSSNFEVK